MFAMYSSLYKELQPDEVPEQMPAGSTNFSPPTRAGAGKDFWDALGLAKSRVDAGVDYTLFAGKLNWLGNKKVSFYTS